MIVAPSCAIAAEVVLTDLAISLSVASAIPSRAGWLAATDADGFLHGDCHTIGTPSMRARHSIIVNVPSGDSVWGKEMRELFGTIPGWKLVGCDSAGNQARGLIFSMVDWR